ncbi:MHYT domain-containing protein [Streptomyces iconiensis]|uniref:MHYT domain-containing protein n=1 Tax=Streptomyces iconiensis TaxID=1384038 RepID=A0ABT6ZWG0_9ACTN|nr:MHYT domain-containing protein [Streptomyces iconiensis]MDJ1133167.1 MHYT domain-containing protein [Streptomyces iconiensis]
MGMMMQSAAGVPVDGFSYGLITPIAAYVVACLGSALGLRCTARALSLKRSERAGWLFLGSLAIGTGIFTMHFLAMMGFTARNIEIQYDLLLTFASLGVAVLVVGVGIFLVGYKGRTTAALLSGGVITGLGVAAMHYLGMASMRMPGSIEYDVKIVLLSIGIAVFAATAALWFAMSVRLVSAAIGAALIMGVAVSGMHYTAMEAVAVHVHSGAAQQGGTSAISTLTPILIGPVLLLLFVGLFVSLDPMMERDGKREWGTRPGEGSGEKLEWTPFER